LNEVDTCIGWFRVINTPHDFCSPDYFDTCSAGPNAIPSNSLGFQYPFQGHSYMGLYTYLWSSFYREVIGTKLTDTLTPGNAYHISLRVSRGNWTNQAYNCSASNKLGMRFTSYEYTNVDTPAINNYAQVFTDSIIEDTVNWVLLDWNYIADSAYLYVYIGNFFDAIQTDTTVIDAPIGQFGNAYYYIDSVNIVCTSANCINGLEAFQIDSPALFYDSENNIINSKGLKEPCVILLYDETGRETLRQRINSDERINISQLSNGLYVAVLQSAHKTAYKKIIKF
jgi:hypothetical protein